VVAEVEELVEREGVFSDVILADVDLEALAALLKLSEASFALNADGHDATGDGDFDGMRRGLELLGGKGAVGDAELRNGVGGGVVIGIGGFGVAKAVGLAESSDLLEFVAALLVEIFFELRLVHEDSFNCC
jgi:hypothetical protein